VWVDSERHQLAIDALQALIVGNSISGNALEMLARKLLNEHGENVSFWLFVTFPASFLVGTCS